MLRYSCVFLKISNISYFYEILPRISMYHDVLPTNQPSYFIPIRTDQIVVKKFLAQVLYVLLILVHIPFYVINCHDRFCINESNKVIS